MWRLRDTTIALLIALVFGLPACSGPHTFDQDDGEGRAPSQQSTATAATPATTGSEAVVSAADPAQTPVAFAATPFTAVYSTSLGEAYGPLERYYEVHASERSGRCGAPYVDGITNTEVVEDTSERLVVEVRYLYRDRIKTDSSSSCVGYGERRFVLARNGSTMNVQEMSGPTRN